MTKLKKRIPVSEFKSKLLGILARAEASGEEIVITRRNKPVATVVPFAEQKVAAKPGTLSHLLLKCDDVVRPVADGDWSVLKS